MLKTTKLKFKVTKTDINISRDAVELSINGKIRSYLVYNDIIDFNNTICLNDNCDGYYIKYIKDNKILCCEKCNMMIERFIEI